MIVSDSLTGRLRQIVERFPGHRVLVVGDVCLDEYLVGRASRLSREAPVPVLEFQRRFTLPGAAANPALNLKALGAEPVLIGIVGDDPEGEALREAIAARGLSTEGLVIDGRRNTILKTRVLAEGSLLFPQQIVRIDRQDRTPLHDGAARLVVERLLAVAGDAEAVLFSDYRSGVITGSLTRVAVDYCRNGAILTADTQGDLGKFAGFRLVKANHQEIEAYLRTRLVADEDFVTAGRAVARETGTTAVLITRGGDGMTLVEREGSDHHLPAVNRSEVFDTTGAGDTVIAVATLALICDASALEAAHLANLAAGIVVRRLGNATASVEEIDEWLPRLQALAGS